MQCRVRCLHRTAEKLRLLRADAGIRSYIRNKTKNMFAHENFTHTSQVQDDFALYSKRTLNRCTEDIKFLLPNLLTLPFIGSII